MRKTTGESLMTSFVGIVCILHNTLSLLGTFGGALSESPHLLSLCTVVSLPRLALFVSHPVHSYCLSVHVCLSACLPAILFFHYLCIFVCLVSLAVFAYFLSLSGRSVCLSASLCLPDCLLLCAHSLCMSFLHACVFSVCSCCSD